MSRPDLSEYKTQLTHNGFVHVPSDMIISKEEREKIQGEVFREERLERDRSNVNPHRHRSDDTILYDEKNSDLAMSYSDNKHQDLNRITIQYNSIHKETRDYLRMHALSYEGIITLLGRILSLIPGKLRRDSGQIGVHAFQTFDTVVMNRHRDGIEKTPVDWVIAYVVRRDGAGAHTQLFRNELDVEPVADWPLLVGELAMHRDSDFLHYVTKLEPSSAYPEPCREALVITIRPPF